MHVSSALYLNTLNPSPISSFISSFPFLSFPEVLLAGVSLLNAPVHGDGSRKGGDSQTLNL